MKKVLIVDDETIITDTLVKIFVQEGIYESCGAYSAEVALEVIKEWQPDLVILDVVLPKMNGVDLAIRLNDRYPSCQVMLFSGQAYTATLIEEAKNAGHRLRILAKPVHPREILSVAAELLGLTREAEHGSRSY